MRTRVWAVLGLALVGVGVAAGRARAQRAALPGAEIGTQAIGIVRVSQGPSHLTAVALPGGEVTTQPTIYAVLFLTPALALEPAVTYVHVSPGDGWTGAALLRLGGYFFDGAHDSPFLYGELGVLGEGGGGDSHSHAGFGLGGGYRWLVADRRLALRLEGRVRRWTTTPDQTEVGLALAVGYVVGRR